MQSRFIEEAVAAFDVVLGEDRNISDHLFYTWQPLTDIHFNPVDMESQISARYHRSVICDESTSVFHCLSILQT